MANGVLRLGCLGDSWVSDWREGLDGSHHLTSPLSSALRSSLEARGWEVSLVAAGFPGGKASTVLELAELCDLQGISKLSETGRSIKGDLPSTLYEMGIYTPGRWRKWTEEVDLLIVILGANDLNHNVPGAEIVGCLRNIRRLYESRGTRVVMASIGGAGPGVPTEEYPEFEEQRRVANSMLQSDGLLIDSDQLTDRLGADVWVEDWHLTPAGYVTLAEYMVEALLPHFPSLGFLARQAPERPLQPNGCGARARLHVAGCHIPSWSSALVGWYALHGDFRGRPMYRQCDREGRGGSLVIFFCSEGQGSKWAGWCLGPEHRWECWARHEDTNALTPPQRGWRLPENGPVDETLVLSFELCSG